MSLTPEHVREQDGAKAVALPRALAATPDALDILHLAELVPVVRERFGLPEQFADDAVLVSLQGIARHSHPRERWRAAFNSNLGSWLASAGCDLNTALNTLLALIPRPTS